MLRVHVSLVKDVYFLSTSSLPALPLGSQGGIDQQFMAISIGKLMDFGVGWFSVAVSASDSFFITEYH